MPDSADESGTASPLRTFPGFIVVGGIGFVVDGTLLSILVHLFDWPHLQARMVSFATAVTVTWLCNRRWVFAATDDGTREYGAYFGVQVVGAAINLGTYALVIALVPTLARLPVLPLAAGAALAMVFNYSAASRWVFSRAATGRE